MLLLFPNAQRHVPSGNGATEVGSLTFAPLLWRSHLKEVESRILHEIHQRQFQGLTVCLQQSFLYNPSSDGTGDNLASKASKKERTGLGYHSGGLTVLVF